MIRVVIAAGDATLRERLRAMLADVPDVEVAAQARDGHEAVQQVHTLQPDVVVMADEMPVCDGWQTAEILSHSGGTSADVLLISGSGSEDMRRAMRAGVRDLLSWPIPAESLIQAVRTLAGERRRRRSPAFALAADPQRMCRIIAVSGAKGGVGKTTLATNLALSLRLETGEPTVLFGLYTQFGDVAMLLNMTPRRGLADLAGRPTQETDAALLEEHMERHATGLQVLAGATTPVALDAVSAPFLDHVFGLLKSQARFVVLDVPPILHPTTLHALAHSAQTLLVANLFDLTTLRNTGLLLEAIGGRYVPREKISLILNRVSRQNRLRVPDIERTLNHPVASQIPNDGRVVPQSVNQGTPFVLSHPRSAVAQSVRDLACRVILGQPGAQ